MAMICYAPYVIIRYGPYDMLHIKIEDLKSYEFHFKEFTLKQLYRTHNEYVKSAVRKEDLLIWNVKDGWEPLCSFLGKEIPNHPVPHDNKGGDMKWNENYASKCKIFVTHIQKLKIRF